MILSKEARKEGEARFSRFRRSVEIEVFSHTYEDGICRNVRCLIEELAELSTRLSVQIHDSAQSLDLMRKYRIDTLPVTVLHSRDMPELRMYGLPLVYGYEPFLDVLALYGGANESPIEGNTKLKETLMAKDERTGVFPLNLLLSRYNPLCKDAIHWFLNLVITEFSLPAGKKAVPSIRFVEEEPQWFSLLPKKELPCINSSSRYLFWPFKVEDLSGFFDDPSERG
ncbi:MAG: hypothetical protein N2509_01160 [Treponemataceae bacterium]|uniref:hypothetical protein n=1 Tax=Treponema sp. J25 TaxID=2094121 RepID=UPI00105405FA|nr:hypothetical protein [Treponema sp. J25]MCX7948700.1 hypothetical protein [Treponemataceae bacterium]